MAWANPNHAPEDTPEMALIREACPRCYRSQRTALLLNCIEGPTDPHTLYVLPDGEPIGGAIWRELEALPTFVPGELCADLEGFCLHAYFRIKHDHREKLERLASPKWGHPKSLALEQM